MTLVRGHQSPAERLVRLPRTERRRIIKSMTDDELEALLYDWHFWARPEQLPPPGDWTTWGIVAGRGAGKTRSGAEFINEEIRAGRSQYPILIGADAGDVRDVMVEGESGILAISPPWFRPEYKPSTRQLIYPNGVVARLFAAHDPDALRGPQSDVVWADEIAKWKYATEAWDNMALGNRLGPHPRRVFTTTPKPIKLLRVLLGRDKSPDESGRRERGKLPPGVVLAPRMSTYDNLANLAPSFIEDVLKKYQGTRLGRQELMGELLLDIPGALWTLERIEKLRVRFDEKPPLQQFSRIVVAIDPAVTSDEDSNETGIIVAGKVGHQPNDHYYVLRDSSGRHTAYEWATEAVRLFREQRADRIVAEVNNGGDLVEAQLRIVEPNIPYGAVHASRGKRTRGEPVAALYEQGKVHHVGAFDELEDQMITWVPDAGEDSPDRADALVWCITELADLQITDEDLPPSRGGGRRTGR